MYFNISSIILRFYMSKETFTNYHVDGNCRTDTNYHVRNNLLSVKKANNVGR